MERVGILCASDTELEPFLPHINRCTITDKAMLRFYHGQMKGVQTVALYSGVGKVNAAVAAQLLIDTFEATALLNVGTAGGMDPRLQVFDTVISTESAYHDMDDDILTDFHPWLLAPLFRADARMLRTAQQTAEGNPSVYFGRMATGERFIEEEGRQAIWERYAPLSVDMETAAVAHVCYVNQIPFLSIRTITDTALQSGGEAFEQNCRRASAVAKDIALDFLEAYGLADREGGR